MSSARPETESRTRSTTEAQSPPPPAEEERPFLLNVMQGTALLTADCMGTGILALPGDIHILGWKWGMFFLFINLPINLYAGTILHKVASAIEQKKSGGRPTSVVESKHQLTKQSRINERTGLLPAAVPSSVTDAAETVNRKKDTFDFVGITRALFDESNSFARYSVPTIFYVNIFLVLGNYILVMAHAVVAMLDDRIPYSTAGVIASIGMFAVSQTRTMAKLGRVASLVSLAALFVVVIQCLIAVVTTGDDKRTLRKDPSSPLEQASPPSLWRQFSAMGSIGFAVGSQKLLLNIRHDLRDRTTAPQILSYSLTAFGVAYATVIAIVNSQSASPPPNFLFDELSSNTWNRRVAGCLLFVHVVVSYAINSQAICSSVDRLLTSQQRPNDDGSDQRNRRCDSAPASAYRWLGLTAVMAITATLVANGIPYFPDLVALIGGLTSVPLALLLPAVYWRRHIGVTICKPTQGTFGSFLLLLFSFVFTITATIGAIFSIKVDESAAQQPES